MLVIGEPVWQCVFFNSDSTIVSLCTNCKMAAMTQPLLTCTASLRNTAQAYIIMVRNDHVTNLIMDSCTVDKLFKLYCQCNLAYSSSRKRLYLFAFIHYCTPVLSVMLLMFECWYHCWVTFSFSNLCLTFGLCVVMYIFVPWQHLMVV